MGPFPLRLVLQTILLIMATAIPFDSSVMATTLVASCQSTLRLSLDRAAPTNPALFGYNLEVSRLLHYRLLRMHAQSNHKSRRHCGCCPW